MVEVEVLSLVMLLLSPVSLVELVASGFDCVISYADASVAGGEVCGGVGCVWEADVTALLSFWLS